MPTPGRMVTVAALVVMVVSMKVVFSETVKLSVMTLVPCVAVRMVMLLATR